MKYITRRNFIKYASLGAAASVLGTPYIVRGSTFLGKSNHKIQGAVCSGSGATSIPLPGAMVSLYAATSGTPRLLGEAVTNSSGTFLIQFKPPGQGRDGILYVTADLVCGLQLVSIVGPILLPFVTINELSTVAVGYAFAQFATDGVLSGDEFGLQIATGMNNNLVSPASGESSTVMTASPNGDETNSWRSTLALANLLALFVQNNGDAIEVFYDLATPPGQNSPSNLLQALSNIARYPQHNVAELYALATEVSVYSPTLASPPDAWTIVVKVNDSGDDNYLFGGPGNIAFDADGYAWISNNVVQGTGHSSLFSVVLKPNGKPADGKNGAPKSPIFGGGILGGGYGVGIAPNRHVWWGNFGWGLPRYYPSLDGNGSVSQFTKNGHPISGSMGYQGGPYRAQAVMPDADGNIWIASFGNDRLYVFLKGNPNRSIYYEDPSGNAKSPFDIQFAKDGTAWVTYSGGLRPGGQSYVGRFALYNGQLQELFLIQLGQSVKGVAVDSFGQGWVASGGEDCVYRVSSQGEVLGKYTAIDVGGGINAPWGISVDGDDNVWVANFGPEEQGNIFTTSAVTKLAGSNPATRPPGLNTGDAISPPSGYTLPSAGDEVLLHNGEPLYGSGAPPSYVPLMRLTAVVIDRAGNVWATNNWKPDFTVDLVNSGGDGICIFVGLAKPKVR
jgi:sugar lactone lactonase YvrE